MYLGMAGYFGHSYSCPLVAHNGLFLPSSIMSAFGGKADPNLPID